MKVKRGWSFPVLPDFPTPPDPLFLSFSKKKKAAERVRGRINGQKLLTFLVELGESCKKLRRTAIP